MKVKDLVKRLMALDADFEVVLSRDAEGNGFSSVGGIGISHFNHQDREIFNEDELEDGEKLNAVVLWPE